MTQKKRSRTPAQIASEKRYAVKRKGNPRLPSCEISESENKFCSRLFKRFGKTKKEAIMAGLRLLDKTIK